MSKQYHNEKQLEQAIEKIFKGKIDLTPDSIIPKSFTSFKEFDAAGGILENKGLVIIGGRQFYTSGGFIRDVGPGFIQTIFDSTFTISTVQVTHSIADYVSKIKVSNSGDEDVWLSFGETAYDVYLGLSDLDGSSAFPISSGLTNIFECPKTAKYFGLIAKTGSNSVRVIQGV